jgi:hypothetical protein
MSGITALGTTYNLPNFVGELFAASPEDTPFLSAIGGLTGGESVGSTVFTWQGYDLRDADATRQRKEGADAPTTEGRARFSVSNVVEIHQEQTSVSYTKQGATRQISTGSAADVQLGTQPVQSELPWQITQELKNIARDVDKSFLQGTYSLPSDANSARKTRGLLAAISTNTGTYVDKAGATWTDNEIADFKEAVLNLMQTVWTNGGIQESETRTILVNAALKRALTLAFVTKAGYEEQSRNVGGVNLQTFETDFGKANIMLERWMPTDQLAVASLEQCAPAFLEIPGKGHFFAEPLAKTGSADKVQIYGEIGLIYGNEKAHGKLTIDDGSSSSSS